MLSSIVDYFWSSAEDTAAAAEAETAPTAAQEPPADTQSPPQLTQDDDWVLLSKEEVLHTLQFQHCACGVSSPTAECMEASWYVTPPACFTDSSSNMSECKPSSMENLLLEHPSMSVYHRRRSSTSSTTSSSSPQRDPSPEQAAAAPPVERVTPAVAHVINKHLTTSQLQSIKSTKAATKHSNRNVHYKQLSRGNKVREVPYHGKSRRHMIAARYSGVCNDRRRC